MCRRVVVDRCSGVGEDGIGVRIACGESAVEVGGLYFRTFWSFGDGGLCDYLIEIRSVIASVDSNQELSVGVA